MASPPFGRVPCKLMDPSIWMEPKPPSVDHASLAVGLVQNIVGNFVPLTTTRICQMPLFTGFGTRDSCFLHDLTADCLHNGCFGGSTRSPQLDEALSSPADDKEDGKADIYTGRAWMKNNENDFRSHLRCKIVNEIRMYFDNLSACGFLWMNKLSDEFNVQEYE